MNWVRLLSLLVLAGALCVCALQGRETRGNSRLAIASASAHLVSSVTPSPSPRPSTEQERPNVVRRFFGWTIDQLTRPFRKEPRIVCQLPLFVHLSASKSLITFCPSRSGVSTSASCSPDREVTLTANGADPGADNQFSYAWAVTAGAIRGEGRQVNWDLSGVAEGTYTATVEMSDGRQHAASTTTTVTIALCSGCDRPPPLCPDVSVSCPADLASRAVTFEAIVKGGDPEMQPTFTWSITAGKIVSGQGESKLVVDASDLGGRSITATVSLGGSHPACSRYTSVLHYLPLIGRMIRSVRLRMPISDAVRLLKFSLHLTEHAADPCGVIKQNSPRSLRLELLDQ